MPVVYLYFLLLFLPYFCFSQIKPDKRIIYKVSSLTSNTKKGYDKLVILEHRIPTIERILQTLSKANNPNEKLFEEVSSLNHFFDEKNHAIFIQKIFKGDTSRNIGYNQDDIEAVLNSIQYFLEIRIVLQGNNAIYNFYLYEMEADSMNPKFIVYEASSDANITINSPENEQINNLTRALKILFNEANNKPKASISVVNSTISNLYHDSVYYFSDGDTLRLLGNIIDDDIREGFIHYEWYAHQTQDANKESTITFKPNEQEQVVVLKKGDNFKINLKVYDGIDYSKKDASIYVKTVYSPHIAIGIDTSFRGDFQYSGAPLYYSNRTKRKIRENDIKVKVKSYLYRGKPINIDLKIQDRDNILFDATKRKLEIKLQNDKQLSINVINGMLYKDLWSFAYTDSIQFYYNFKNNYCNILIYPPATIPNAGKYTFDVILSNGYIESNRIKLDLSFAKLQPFQMGIDLQYGSYPILNSNNSYLTAVEYFDIGILGGLNFDIKPKFSIGIAGVIALSSTQSLRPELVEQESWSAKARATFRFRLSDSPMLNWYMKMPVEICYRPLLKEESRMSSFLFNIGMGIGVQPINITLQPVVYLYGNFHLLYFQTQGNGNTYSPLFNGNGRDFFAGGVSLLFHFLRTEGKTHKVKKQNRLEKQKILYVKMIK